MANNVPNNSLSHFSINVVDTDRAIDFYRTVFDWKFTPWGPPGFHLVDTGGDVHGSVQRVQAEPFPTHIGNFECTLTVDDVDRVSGLIVAQGGEITLPKVTIPGVADIARCKDTEGNTFSIARYL
ncbi:MAG: VOC family protein [Fimbriimonadaceae bacterium]